MERIGILASGDDRVKLGDKANLWFGDGSLYDAGDLGDVKLQWDAAKLVAIPTVDDSQWYWGNGTLTFDQRWYGSDTSHYMSFDASADRFKFEDSVGLHFGTGNTAGEGAAGDVQMSWNGTQFNVLGLADDQVFAFGNGTNSYDVQIYGNVAGDYVLWDASASQLSLVGAGGGSRRVGGLAYTNTAASTAISGTSSETLFSTTYSIPASSLQAGQMIRVRFQGIATATNSTDTLAIKLYIGGLTGTALISMAATDVANNDVFSGEYILIVRDVGATGHIVGYGTYKSVPAAEGTATYKDDILASTVIDTTAAQVVGVSATWSTTSAGNSARLDVLTVEIY